MQMQLSRAIYRLILRMATHGPGHCGVNRPGFGHLAFAVDDVHAAREAVLDAGGSAVGEVVTVQDLLARGVAERYRRWLNRAFEAMCAAGMLRRKKS